MPYQISSELLHRIDPELAAPALAARNAPIEDVRRMLASDDPRTISLGLVAVMWKCRPDLLVEAVWLVGDDRPALPKLAVSHATGEPFLDPTPRTIGERFQSLLHFWMRGLPWEGEPLREALLARPDPWLEVNPWRVRLQSLAVDKRAAELAAAKTDFEKRPDHVRWLVVTEPQLNPKTRPAFTEAEIKAVLDSLSPETKRRIADRTIELPRDYQVRRERGERQFLDSLFQRYDELTRRE